MSESFDQIKKQLIESEIKYLEMHQNDAEKIKDIFLSLYGWEPLERDVSQMIRLLKIII